MMVLVKRRRGMDLNFDEREKKNNVSIKQEVCTICFVTNTHTMPSSFVKCRSFCISRRIKSRKKITAYQKT